jgi:hypothetical protein
MLRAMAPLLLVGAVACRSTGNGGPEITVSVVPREATVAPGGQQAFTAVVSGGGSTGVAWSIREGGGGGSIDTAGLYTAPGAAGNYHVVAREPVSGRSGEASVTVAASCWRLDPLTRVRVHPRAGYESAMGGGAIQGSNVSTMNDFVTLHTIGQAAPGWNEIPIAGAAPFRYVKYTASSGTGSIAEVEFLAGTARLGGAPFGTTGTTGHGYSAAFDGDTATYYEGTGTVSNYVGIDLADGHVVAAPTMNPPPGSYGAAQSVTLLSATPGATIHYSTDGSDPANGAVYGGPIALSSTTTLRAVATASCAQRSDTTTGLYTIGGGPALSESVYLLGNSLTDTVVVDSFLQLVAAAGGVDLTFHRFTVPGAGTYVYPNNPSAAPYMQNTPGLTQVTFQPAENMPCLPFCTVGPTDGCVSCSGAGAGECWNRQAPFVTGTNSSDADNIDMGWDHAQPNSPGATFWVYQTWPRPDYFTGCMTGGWERYPPIWNPAASTTYEMNISTRLRYVELVRDTLISRHPTRTTPYIIPGGMALAALKARIQAGTFPGLAPADWPSFVYAMSYADDDHMNKRGSYFISLVFYSALFQRDPRDLPDTALGTTATGLSAAQYAAFQEVAYDAVTGYALSGWTRAR